MLAMFQAILKGRPLLAEKPDEELFQVDAQEVRAALESELEGESSRRAWTFLCHPVRYQANRWEETDMLERIIEKSVVRIRREFPSFIHDTHVREWGICNRRSEDAFGLTRSGFFLSARLFRGKHPHVQEPVATQPRHSCRSVARFHTEPVPGD